MGRHAKTVRSNDGLDRRNTGYYSTPTIVADFIKKKLLSIKSNPSHIFDPCVGNGELLVPFRGTGARMTGFDIIDFKCDSFYDFRCCDFLLSAVESLDNPLLYNTIPPADIIVANPPYNCHEHEYLRRHKAEFSRCFGNGSALNLYSSFLSAIIQIAKPGCIVGVITSDSFLTARGHEALRRLIRDECRIHTLLLCPTDLFQNQMADVRTSILILEKGRQGDYEIEVSSRPDSVREFEEVLNSKSIAKCTPKTFLLSSAKDRGEFLVEVPSSIRSLFDYQRLGELFPCKTGISTGNDRLHLSPVSKNGFKVPFYKNPGSRRFFSAADAFLCDNYLELSRTVPNFMVRNKPYIGRPGISCSSMGVPFGAAILPEDSAFGVNANIFPREEDRWWLLCYLNSSLCNYIVRGVLLRSNMITAGYVSRIPVPKLSYTVRNELDGIARQAYSSRPSPYEAKDFVRRIDQVVFEVCNVPKAERRSILEFCANIIRRT